MICYTHIFFKKLKKKKNKINKLIKKKKKTNHHKINKAIATYLQFFCICDENIYDLLS